MRERFMIGLWVGLVVAGITGLVHRGSLIPAALVGLMGALLYFATAFGGKPKERWEEPDEDKT